MNRPIIHRRRSGAQRLDRAFVALCALAALLPVALLLAFVAALLVRGCDALTWEFVTSLPSRNPADAGIWPAVVGSLQLVLLTGVFCLPLGTSAAIYLQEYGRGGRFERVLELNIANLAGVPSVVYGLLGLGVFVRTIGLGRSLVAGAATLSLLAMPVVIIATREALRAVPTRYREACSALGATRFQTLWQVVLPAALPGMSTGAILALSRVVGEAAPLVVVGALAYVPFVPDGLDAPFTALPVQIFHWALRPEPGFRDKAAAAIVVLLSTTFVLNSVAIVVRDRFDRR